MNRDGRKVIQRDGEERNGKERNEKGKGEERIGTESERVGARKELGAAERNPGG